MNTLQVSEPGKYLKGLCVVDDIAFFGIAPSAPRDRRADPSLNCELAAFDLQQRLLLWRRQLPTHGLLNVGEARRQARCRLPGQKEAQPVLLLASACQGWNKGRWADG